jgi:putative membrane protein
MKKTFAIAIAAFAISAVPALAQTAGTSGTAKTHHAKSSSVKVSDDSFVKKAAIGGMEEVELGNLAKQKASSNDVKQFGDRMVADHSKADDQLKQVAQQKNVPLPTSLDAKHKATVDRLSKLSGDAFDKAYMKEMLTDHEHDVAAFKEESTSGKDADVKQFASNTLPTLEDHLKLAQDTASKVGVSPAAATSGHKKSKKGSGL